ncbi:hypothetical protein V3468_08350 [Flavobacterium oreochromis]|uniref:hypothetical protein n=1 Tax=Flavobacterium oreochromis TaxID=2906078 RepID=UPI00385EA0A0
MKLVKIISHFLFYIVRIVAVGYLLTSLFVLVSTLFKLPNLQMLDAKRFAINFPFSDTHFLLGTEFTFNYVTEMVLGIGLYGLFFWVLSGVFSTFKQERLFTLQGMTNLKYFYLFNLIVYPLLIIVWAVVSIEDFPFLAMVIAHAIMGVFILFMYAIFAQGVHLQNEQDLYI